MEDRILNADQLPDAPLFVRAHDSYMSGWGPAENLKNILLLPCDNNAEATRLQKYVHSRSEMKNVQIITRPQAKALHFSFAYVQCKTREEYPMWYTAEPVKREHVTYEGWWNYATWNYVLWLDNNYTSYHYLLDMLSRRRRPVNNQFVREALKNIVGTTTPDGAQLVHVKLREVADYLETKRLELRAEIAETVADAA